MKPSLLIAVSVACASALHAQAGTPPKNDSIAKLNAIKVAADSSATSHVSPLQALTLPVSASVTTKEVAETVNLLDVEDAVKYLPSVMLRKRNYGDNQAVLGTRIWGIGGSARSLVFADGVPITALVANNNGNGSPHWGLVSPAEIDRVDMMYGPFSAAYAGNSIGAVMEITTRLPDKLEGSVSQTQAIQPFHLYGTDKSFGTMQTSADVGDRFGKLAIYASGNYQDSHSQPLSYATATAFPGGTTGGYAETNKLAAPADILGATGMLHSRMTNAKIKLAYDITPVLRASYTFGHWGNISDAGEASYLEKGSTSTLAGQSAFASGIYHLDEQHSSHSLSLRTNTKGDWDFDGAVTRYIYDTDNQRSPSTTTAADTFASAGKVVKMNGTAWTTVDLKGTWHRGGFGATHTVSFGAHYDQYTLVNTTYNTPDWTTGDSLSGIASQGNGKTRTQALWAQDRWRLTPNLSFTFGGRSEAMRGYDGININGKTTVNQPTVTFSKFSPKAVLDWTASAEWSVTASVGKAYRFATASELYQLVTTGTTFTSPNPNLKPDNVLATELRVQRRFEHGDVQLSYFGQDVHDAIISQFEPLVTGSSTLYSFLSNVDHVRARGAELAFNTNDVMVHGLGFSGSATYLDAVTLATSGQASATATPGSAIGKQLPNIPRWRGSLVSSYHPDQKWSFSLAGRYSGKLYTTLDNSDVHPNTYQGFAEWFVADGHVLYRVDHHWSAQLGADNLLDRKYFLFHPFPQRTFVADLKYAW